MEITIAIVGTLVCALLFLVVGALGLIAQRLEAMTAGLDRIVGAYLLIRENPETEKGVH